MSYWNLNVSLDPVFSAISTKTFLKSIAWRLCMILLRTHNTQWASETRQSHPFVQSPQRMGTERTSSGNGTEDGFSPDKEHHILIVTKNTGWLVGSLTPEFKEKIHEGITLRFQTKKKITHYIHTYHAQYIIGSGSIDSWNASKLDAPNRNYRLILTFFRCSARLLPMLFCCNIDQHSWAFRFSFKIFNIKPFFIKPMIMVTWRNSVLYSVFIFIHDCRKKNKT